LNPDSPRGSNKARAFATALGITAADAPKLREELLEIARVGEVQRTFSLSPGRLGNSKPRINVFQ
jgi:hypothetical protein